MVVAVDIDISKKARYFADAISAPLAIVEKRRLGNQDRVESMNVIGEIGQNPVIMFDDEISTGGTMLSAVDAIIERGAKEIYVVATHGVLPGDASSKITQVPQIKELVITNTVPLSEEKVNSKIKVISIAPLIGEAIRRIHEGRSVGELFNN